MSYPKKTIYLAGPITNLTHDAARYGWRTEFVKHMEPYEHIYCRSPMRGKDMLKDFGVLSSGAGYPDNAMTTPEGITARDRNDVRTSDAMIACFLESKGLSGGTFIEYGWADAYRVPVLGVGPADDPNLKHLMAQAILGWRVETLEEAAIIMGHLLTPGI